MGGNKGGEGREEEERDMEKRQIKGWIGEGDD